MRERAVPALSSANARTVDHPFRLSSCGPARSFPTEEQGTRRRATAHCSTVAHRLLLACLRMDKPSAILCGCNQRKGAIFPVLPGSVSCKTARQGDRAKADLHSPRQEKSPPTISNMFPRPDSSRARRLGSKSCIDLLSLNPLEDLVKERSKLYSAYVGLVRRSAACREAKRRRYPARKLDKLKATLQGAAKYSLVGHKCAQAM